MRRMYHIVSDWTAEMSNTLKKYGIDVDAKFMAIQIEESTYLKVLPFFKKWGISGIFYPEFSKNELKEAKLSALKTTSTHGYPMPDIDFGYKKITYDLTCYCYECGIGLIQKDKFRIKNEPPMGKKSIFSLGWVYDELFVNIDVFEKIFKPLGINSMEVLKYKTEIPFKNTVQLVLKETSEKLDLLNWPAEKCEVCGQIKYQPMAQDFFPLYNNIIAPIFKSNEYFGSGANAYKRIFLTKELREELIKLKIQKDDWFFPAK